MQRVPGPHTLALEKMQNPTQTLTHPSSWLRNQYGVSEPGSSQTFCPRLTNHNHPHTALGVEQHIQMQARGAEVAFMLPPDKMTGNEELGTLTTLSPLPCGTGSEPEIHQKPRAGLKKGMQDPESTKGEACRARWTGRQEGKLLTGYATDSRGTTQDSSAAQPPTGITY